MFDKIEEVKKYLNRKYVEREDVIDAIFISLVARQHCLLIGPPGTGKSALVADTAKLIGGIEYFQWLLTRFSTPEELFGPVSLKELEKGVYKRNTDSKLPEAHFTFLDEIFKANSAILNALLTLINERLFYNNGNPVKTPLISVVGASNEYPEEGEGLEALFDRFLLRYELDYIGEDSSFLSMLDGCNEQAPEPLTLSDIELIQFLSEMVVIGDDVKQSLLHIRTDLKDEGIRPSDRRFRQALSLIKAKAALDQRQHALVTDIGILKDGLWETVDQREKVYEIVDIYAADRLLKELEHISVQGKEVFEKAKANQSTDVGLEATAKLKSLLADIKKLESQYSSRIEEIKPVRERVENAQRKIGEVILGL